MSIEPGDVECVIHGSEISNTEFAGLTIKGMVTFKSTSTCTQIPGRTELSSSRPFLSLLGSAGPEVALPDFRGYYVASGWYVPITIPYEKFVQESRIAADRFDRFWHCGACHQAVHQSRID